MLKKRLIFTLLDDNGEYQLSRNFGLQQVGDLQWLRENYDFDAIAYHIDELVVLNVAREENDVADFAGMLLELSRRYFLPVTAGGRVRSLQDASLLLRSNADKIVVNTPLFDDPDLVRALSRTFGAQCVVASLDCRAVDGGHAVFTDRGARNTGLDPARAVELAQELGAGEIYLTSMDKDGTGFGYDLSLYEGVRNVCRVPVIMSGGVGKSEHFVQGLEQDGVTGVSTANIYNFMVDGLKAARRHILSKDIPLAQWGADVDDLRGSVEQAGGEQA